MSAEPISPGDAADERAAAAPPLVPSANPPTAPPRRWIRLMLRLALLSVVVGGVVGGLMLASRPAPDLVQGMADADAINVSAKISARVARLLVQEGDVVASGQVLFQLDSPEVAARQRQAQALLDAARAQRSKTDEGTREEEVRAAEAGLRRAEAAAELARSTFVRTESLYRQGVMTRQRYEEAQAQSRTASEAVAAVRAQVDEAHAGARRQDRQAAHAHVRQAEGGVDEVQAAQDEVNGRAPADGEVNKRLADAGELVPAGYPVFTLIDLRKMWVAMYLREDQFAGVRNGRTLLGDIPALGLERVAFTVYFIAPAGDFATWRATRQSAGYDVKSFEVRARPERSIANFRPGMSVLFPWPQP